MNPGKSSNQSQRISNCWITVWSCSQSVSVAISDKTKANPKLEFWGPSSQDQNIEYGRSPLLAKVSDQTENFQILSAFPWTPPHYLNEIYTNQEPPVDKMPGPTLF
jgi:hypothetical protein